MFRIRPIRMSFLALGIVLAASFASPADAVHEIRGRVLDKSSLAPLPKWP